jgi:hypothetical protein
MLLCMEDVLNFKETQANHWHAEYDDITFDIERSTEDFELKVEGRDVHQSIHCGTLEEAQERAKKFLVW